MLKWEEELPKTNFLVGKVGTQNPNSAIFLKEQWQFVESKIFLIKQKRWK
jgi:hypothetical protein